MGLQSGPDINRRILINIAIAMILECVNPQRQAGNNPAISLGVGTFDPAGANHAPQCIDCLDFEERDS